MSNTPRATFGLVGLNVVVFLLANHVFADSEISAFGLPLYFPLNDHFHLWQFVTSLFMHANLSHLFMNMFGLVSFGSILERMWGPKRFVIFYIVAGLGAGLIHNAVGYFSYSETVSALAEQGVTVEVAERLNGAMDPRSFFYQLQRDFPEAVRSVGQEKVVDLFYTFHVPVVGASGAIYGILTAFGLMFPNAKLSLIFLPVPIAAKYFIPGLLLMDLFSGVTGVSLFGGGIAHFAHVGGAVIGFLLMWVWRSRVPDPRLERGGGQIRIGG